MKHRRFSDASGSRVCFAPVRTGAHSGEGFAYGEGDGMERTALLAGLPRAGRVRTKGLVQDSALSAGSATDADLLRASLG